VDGTYAQNDRELFRELYNSLLNAQPGQVADRYFILADFRSYANAEEGGGILPQHDCMGKERDLKRRTCR